LFEILEWKLAGYSTTRACRETSGMRFVIKLLRSEPDALRDLFRKQ
jgi:hypothetical protein